MKEYTDVLTGTASFISNEYTVTHQSQSPEHTFSVFNPVTHETIAVCHNATHGDLEKAISSAKQVFEAGQFPAHARQAFLTQWADGIEAKKQRIAQLVTAETGKTVTDALAEIDYALSYLRFYADLIPSLSEVEQGDDYIVQQQPVGVVAAITPWNFPVAMVLRKVAAAIGAGCPVVLKPSDLTPLSALAMAECASNAGLAPGWLSIIVTQHAEDIGAILCRDKRIAKLTFTGSTQVGIALNTQCAKSLKRVSMELGGNAPFLVCADADIELAVSQLLANKLRNMGQTCVAANRIYVAESIQQAFVEKLSHALSDKCAGDVQDSRTQLGYMIHSKAASRADALIEHAQAQGATVITGGTYHAGSAYLAPTVLTNVKHDDDIGQQEIFAPVFPIISVQNDTNIDNWLKLANDTSAGLVAYAFTQNAQWQTHFAQTLQAGMVGINTGVISNAKAPFGGIKQSGFGREGGQQGFADFTALKYVKRV